MSKFAFISLPCILGLAAMISRADEQAPRTFRLQRQTAHGVEEKFVSEEEYNQFNQDAEKRERRNLAVDIQQYAYPRASAPPVPVSAPAAICQPGVFTVISDGKRSILLNTATSASWLLVVDPQGAHWQQITACAQPYTPPQAVPYSPGPETPQTSTAAPVPKPNFFPHTVGPQPALNPNSNTDPQKAALYQPWEPLPKAEGMLRVKDEDMHEFQARALQDLAKNQVAAAERRKEEALKEVEKLKFKLQEVEDTLKQTEANYKAFSDAMIARQSTEQAEPQVDAAEREKPNP